MIKDVSRSTRCCRRSLALFQRSRHNTLESGHLFPLLLQFRAACVAPLNKLWAQVGAQLRVSAACRPLSPLARSLFRACL